MQGQQHISSQMPCSLQGYFLTLRLILVMRPSLV